MKPKDLRDMPLDDLRSKERDLKKELFNLKMQNALGQAENPLRIRYVKRDVARAKTIIAEKERGE